MWKMIHVAVISTCLGYLFNFTFPLTASCTTVSVAICRDFCPCPCYPIFHTFLWNLGGSLYDSMIFAFCLVEKPAQFGKYHKAFAILWALPGFAWTMTVIAFDCGQLNTKMNLGENSLVRPVWWGFHKQLFSTDSSWKFIAYTCKLQWVGSCWFLRWPQAIFSFCCKGIGFFLIALISSNCISLAWTLIWLLFWPNCKVFKYFLLCFWFSL